MKRKKSVAASVISTYKNKKHLYIGSKWKGIRLIPKTAFENEPFYNLLSCISRFKCEIKKLSWKNNLWKSNKRMDELHDGFSKHTHTLREREAAHDTVYKSRTWYSDALMTSRLSSGPWPGAWTWARGRTPAVLFLTGGCGGRLHLFCGGARASGLGTWSAALGLVLVILGRRVRCGPMVPTTAIAWPVPDWREKKWLDSNFTLIWGPYVIKTCTILHAFVMHGMYDISCTLHL